MPTHPKKPEGWIRKTADLAKYQREYRAAHPEKFREYEKRKKKRKRTPEENRAKYERKMRRIHGESWTPSKAKGKRQTNAERKAVKKIKPS
jgi:hypothetical protein